MDEAADCLCSALALNCCQFALFTHKSSPRCIGSSKNNDWMSKLDASKKLRDVVIPGTHNSASSTISKWSLFSGVAKCQNMTVYQQLNQGARYLDMRVCGREDDIVTCHGIVKGVKLSDVVDEVKAFLCDNQNEFVIVEIKDESPMTSSQKHLILHLIRSTFGESMISYADLQTWFQLKHVTMNDIRRRQKNVLVLIHNSFCFARDGISYDMHMLAKEFACHNNSSLLQNNWHNTANASDLLHRNLTHLRQLSRYDRDFLICNQLVLTPQRPRHMVDTMRHLFGVKSLRPISLAKQLYKEEDALHCFVRDRPGLHWNIVSLDFIDRCPQFINFLIAINSSR
jgi:hypothetical protein